MIVLDPSTHLLTLLFIPCLSSTLALEVRLKTMWCGQCRDSVHCAEVDRLSDRIGAETARLVASLSSGTSPSPLPSQDEPTLFSPPHPLPYL